MISGPRSSLQEPLKHHLIIALTAGWAAVGWCSSSVLTATRVGKKLALSTDIGTVMMWMITWIYYY